jgi:hypothetical protein
MRKIRRAIALMHQLIGVLRLPHKAKHQLIGHYWRSHWRPKIVASAIRINSSNGERRVTRKPFRPAW